MDSNKTQKNICTSSQAIGNPFTFPLAGAVSIHLKARA